MISILTPTRGRPANVRRLITSVFSTAEQPSQVELLFYVDSDDETFPEEVISENIRVVRGPRMWLSVLQNILYANCRGEIVNVLQNHALGQTEELSMSRMKAIEILLRKSIADLSAISLTGPGQDGSHVFQVIERRIVSSKD